MIYTLTLSPSLDLWIRSDYFELETVNRYAEYELLPGGKGVNASVILTRHDYQNKAVVFYDQNTFNSFRSLWEKEGLDIVNIPVEQPTRVNIKYYGTNTFFELNGPSFRVSENEWNQLMSLLTTLNENDTLMVMGKGDEHQLKEIVKICTKKGIRLVLDVISSNYLELIRYKPYVIKPNINELKIIFNDLHIVSDNDVLKCMDKLQEIGTANILVSCGDKGCFLLTDKGKRYKSVIKDKVKVVSATGAGDTLISMFSVNYLLTQDPIQSLLIATSASLGTVCVNWLGDQVLSDYYQSYIEIIEL